MSAAHPVPVDGAPRYFGSTTVTEWPRRASACGSALHTSASPPVLANGRASEVTNRMSSAFRSRFTGRGVRGVAGTREVRGVPLVRRVPGDCFFAIARSLYDAMRRLGDMNNLRLRTLT